MINYYRVLGCSLNDSQRKVYKTFMRKASHLHPNNPNRRISERDRFISLCEAYYVLGDMDQRAPYDLIFRNKYENKEIEYSQAEIESLLEQWKKNGNKYATKFCNMLYNDFKKAIPKPMNLFKQIIYIIWAVVSNI